MGGPGLEYRLGREFVVSSKSSRPEMGLTQLLTHRVRGVKLPENKTSNSLPQRSEVRTTGAIQLLTSIRLYSVYRDNSGRPG